jgi:hypothetical protein
MPLAIGQVLILVWRRLRTSAEHQQTNESRLPLNQNSAKMF